MTGRLARGRARRIVAVLMALAGTAAVFALLAAPATAQAPDVAAWWSAANVGNGAPAPPVPPDVAAGDLLVQGSNPSSSVPTTPVSGAPPTSTAVAGLSFALPTGAIVGRLTLALDGTVPPQESVVACRATRSFFAEENGAWSDVPPSDCTQTVTSALDNSTLVFADIAKLVQNDRLDIVLLPGPVDRVVIKKPTDSALQVSSPTGLGPAAPPFGAGTNAGPIGGGGPVAPVGGPAVLPPVSGTGPVAAIPPVVAPSTSSGATSTAAGQPVAATARSGGDGLTTAQRRTLAAVVIGLELVGFLLLLGDRDPESAVAGTPLLAGGRLRPPDRGVASSGIAGSVAVGGIGRFRAPRQGPAPRL